MLEELAAAIIPDGFFSRFLAYTFLPGEREIYEAHAERIKAAEERVREQMLDYAEELLLKFRPQLRGKSVRIEEWGCQPINPIRST